MSSGLTKRSLRGTRAADLTRRTELLRKLELTLMSKPKNSLRRFMVSACLSWVLRCSSYTRCTYLRCRRSISSLKNVTHWCRWSNISLKRGKLNSTLMGGGITTWSAGLSESANFIHRPVSCAAVRLANCARMLLRSRNTTLLCGNESSRLDATRLARLESFGSLFHPTLTSTYWYPALADFCSTSSTKSAGVCRIVSKELSLTPKDMSLGLRSLSTQSCFSVFSLHRSPRSKKRLYSGMSLCSPLSSSHTTVSSSALNACRISSLINVLPLRAVVASRMSCARLLPAPSSCCRRFTSFLVIFSVLLALDHRTWSITKSKMKEAGSCTYRSVQSTSFWLLTSGLQLIQLLPRLKWSTAVASGYSCAMSVHGTLTRHMSPFSSLTSTECFWSTLEPLVSSLPTRSRQRSFWSCPHSSGYAVSRSRITALSKCSTFSVRYMGPVHALAMQCSSNGTSFRYCSLAMRLANSGECFFSAPMNPADAKRLSPPGSATRNTSLLRDAATVNSSVGSRSSSMLVSM
mmetsp:Transcript_8356/g.21122  ORF Transcript_8356/g.21122 Transcript_8356/m.21122 type:complete len:519 (-) Transcript_8356:315-1871(-)